jgi:hypothetical protein
MITRMTIIVAATLLTAACIRGINRLYEYHFTAEAVSIGIMTVLFLATVILLVANNEMQEKGEKWLTRK